jgi:hypothetical protein
MAKLQMRHCILLIGSLVNCVPSDQMGISSMYYCTVLPATILPVWFLDGFALISFIVNLLG